MSRWLWALLAGVVLVAIAAVFWIDQTSVPPPVSRGATPVAPAPAPASTAQNAAPSAPSSPSPPGRAGGGSPAGSGCGAQFSTASRLASRSDRAAPRKARGSSGRRGAAFAPACSRCARRSAAAAARARTGGSQEVAAIYAPKSLAQLVGTWAYSAGDCERLFQRRGGGWAYRQPVDKFAQAAIVESPKRILLPSAICRIESAQGSGRHAQGQRRLRGLDQLYVPKRDDRAPLRHRTHLQRFRRFGAGDNPEEMRAVSGRLGGRTGSVWDFLARGCFALKTQIKRVGFPWISLDSLVRIETYQWVTRDFRSKVFRAAFAPWPSKRRKERPPRRLCGSAEGFMEPSVTQNSDFLQSIVAPTRRKLNRPGGFGHNGDEHQDASDRAAHERSQVTASPCRRTRQIIAGACAVIHSPVELTNSAPED